MLGLQSVAAHQDHQNGSTQSKVPGEVGGGERRAHMLMYWSELGLDLSDHRVTVMTQPVTPGFYV